MSESDPNTSPPAHDGQQETRARLLRTLLRERFGSPAQLAPQAATEPDQEED